MTIPDKHTDDKTARAIKQTPEAPDEFQSYLKEQEEGVKFLRTKFSDLHKTPEVDSAAARAKVRTGKPVSQKPSARIANYLHRFREILNRKDEDKRHRGIEALKRVLHKKFVIRPNEIPEAAFQLEQRIAREMGYGDVEITEDFRRQKTAQIINNQTQSLDKWVDYLSTPDADYPDWAKYWAFRSVLEMGKLQKETDENGKETARYQKRRKDTVASFPALNPRALAMTIGALKDQLAEKKRPKAERAPIENKSVKLSADNYRKLVSTESFPKIYTQFLIEMPEYSTEGLREIRGNWVAYPQGSDAAPLVKSLEGYPLEWCTADFDTAQRQLEGGDFHVYYSINEAGEAVIPRLAIRMQGEHIAEDPRGIAPNQNTDPYITPVLEEKLKEFGAEGDAYKKKSADMKRLTAIEQKHKDGKALSADELRFLYEIDSGIEGFGYEKDPRVEEIKQARNKKADFAAIYGVREDQVIEDLKELEPETRVYMGEETYRASQGTTVAQIQFLSKIHHLTTDLTDISRNLKDMLTGWQGNIIDNSDTVEYSNLKTVGGFFDANNATEFKTGLTFPLEERLTSKPKHYKRLEGIDNEKVKAALEASPEAMISLLRMELSGGAPDIIAETDDAYIFADCSAESPLRRRNLDFDQSAEMAERFDVEMMDEETYRKIQETGQFDLNSWSWLKTPADVRGESGFALFGYRYEGRVGVSGSSADDHGPDSGWRALLRVPKS